MELVVRMTSSACTSASVELSHVITALGFGEERAHCSLCFGLGQGSDAIQVSYAIEVVGSQVANLRTISDSMKRVA